METERIIVDKVCKHNPVVKYSLILMNKFPYHSNVFGVSGFGHFVDFTV